jgi:hypothetical protein
VKSKSTKNKPIVLQDQKKTPSPSNKLLSLVKEIASSFMKLEDKINKAVATGEEEGFTARQVGDLIKEEMKIAGRSMRTVQLYLPAEAKGKPRGATTQINLEKKAVKEKEISANFAQNQNESVPESSQPQQEEQLTDNQKLERKWKTSEPQQQQQEQPQPEPQQQEQTEDEITASTSTSQYTLNTQLNNENAKLRKEVQRLETENELLREENKKLKDQLATLSNSKKLKAELKRIATEVAIEEQAQTQTTQQPKSKTKTKPTPPPLEEAQKIAQSQGIKSRSMAQLLQNPS